MAGILKEEVVSPQDLLFLHHTRYHYLTSILGLLQINSAITWPTMPVVVLIPLLYLSGEILLARPLLSNTQGDLTGLLTEVKELLPRFGTHIYDRWKMGNWLLSRRYMACHLKPRSRVTVVQKKPQ